MRKHDKFRRLVSTSEHYARTRQITQYRVTKQTSPERVEFISSRYRFAMVRVVRLVLLKRFRLNKFDRKTFPSYWSSALYVSIPGYYFSITCILIDLFKIIQRSYISKIRGWNVWLNLTHLKQTAQPECTRVHLLLYRFCQCKTTV